jgi:ribonuclease Z
MIDIFFLGTGGAAATVERDNTALALRCGQDLVLVDCPGSVTRKLKAAGLDPSAIRAILVTHVHPDHIYGLPSLVHSLMLEDLRIPLYGSRGSADFCRRLLDLFHLQDESIRCRIDFFPLKEGEDFSLLPGVSCRAFAVPHQDSSLAFQWRFQDQRKSLLYSGDTPMYEPLFEAAAGTDCLIHDCSVPSRLLQQYPFLPRMHTGALDLGRQAQQARVKRLIPCHFFGELDYTMEEVIEEIRRFYRGDLIIPRDLDRVRL